MERLAGPVAEAQFGLLGTAALLMLVVVLPATVLTLVFAARFRAGGRASYRPDWDRSTALELLLWGVPLLLIGVLGTMVWQGTHRLDPYRPLPGAEPVRVQAVALDWKWLFIYPDLGIATVNELAFPQARPLALEITSAVAMNSFMIPQLGGQIYAMARMETRLNLAADRTGTFEGRNMLYSGDGFAEQTFLAHAMDEAAFAAWLAEVRAAPGALTDAAYADLRRPTIAHPVTRYRSVEPLLFRTIVVSFAGGDAFCGIGP